MPLIEELTRSGTWLFRWRSYLPLAFIALAFGTMVTQSPLGVGPDVRLWWDAVCLELSGFGFAIRAWTIAHVPAGTSGRGTRGQQAETLNTRGIYSTVRHPLYLGNFFMGVGIALFPMLWWLVAIYVLAFWLYYERIMLAEEAFLRDKFGDQYLHWAAETPAFVPSFRRYRPAELPFSLRNVLKREYNGVFAVVVSMFLLDVAGWWRAERALGVHDRWVWLLSVAVVFWAITISVKRRTSWLGVPGR